MKAFTFLVLSLGFTITVQAYGKTSAKNHIINSLGIKDNATLYCIKAVRITNAVFW